MRTTISTSLPTTNATNATIAIASTIAAAIAAAMARQASLLAAAYLPEKRILEDRYRYMTVR